MSVFRQKRNNELTTRPLPGAILTVLMIQEAKSHEPPNANHSLTRISEQLQAQRQRSCEFLTTQNERLDEIEQRLTSELNKISDGIVAWEQFQTDLERQRIELRKEKQQLEQRRVDLESRSCELDQQQSETESQRRKVARQLRAKRAELRAAAHGRDQELQEKIQQLETELEELKTSTTRNSQDRAALQEELEAERGRRSQLENEFASARTEIESKRAEEANLRQQVARNRELLNERAEQLKTLRQQLESVTQAAADHDEQHLTGELLRLQQECDQLRTQVSELSQSDRGPLADSTDKELAELRSRFELAVENVRELKTRNEELEKALAQVDQAAANHPAEIAFDWESQKQLLMNQLEDAHGNGNTSAEERHSIESTVRLTDELVAKKDREIGLLKEQCELFAKHLEEQQSTELTDLESDERIIQERQRLKELQEEWREKVRAAEVDLAVERAHSGRVRRELEEKTRDLEAQLALARKQTSVNARNNSPQPRRWLPNLGRRGDDQA